MVRFIVTSDVFMVPFIVTSDEAVIEPLIVPPNTRVPSPHPDTDSARLPYAEPIPGEYIGLATPWIEVRDACST